jgi:pimeloyl-ACP methyl ester carboxylesterase
MRNIACSLLLAIGCAHLTHDTSIQGPQGRLHVEDGGRGPAVPVLFVHGNGANLTQWRAQLDHLRLTRRAVAFDLRGMGHSDVPANGDYSVAAMVDDVQAVADGLHLKRFVIVGHSYGGTVVGTYAAKHQERVAGLVFADAAGTVKFTDEAAAKFIAALRADKDGFTRRWFGPILAKTSTPQVQDAVYASVHATPVYAFAGALEGMRRIDPAKMVAGYHGPRVAIVAADIEGPSSLHVEFPEVPAKRITGTGHWLMMDKPEEFNRALDEFLATVDAQAK